MTEIGNGQDRPSGNGVQNFGEALFFRSADEKHMAGGGIFDLLERYDGEVSNVAAMAV